MINIEMLNQLKVGIIGCGHLGQAIACSFKNHGLESQNLYLSYRGNPDTYETLERLGLAASIASNEQIFSEAGIILITLRPQDIFELKKCIASQNALIISVMAGLSLELLELILGRQVFRMMFSGPDTLVAESGVATMFPEHEILESMLHLLKLRHIQIQSEDELDIFTAGVCLPAALAYGADRIVEGFDSLLMKLYTWASEVLPDFKCDKTSRLTSTE